MGGKKPSKDHLGDRIPNKDHSTGFDYGIKKPDYIVKVRKQPGAIIPNNALLNEINELLKHS